MTWMTITMNGFQLVNYTWLWALIAICLLYSLYIGAAIHWSVAPILFISLVSGLWTFGALFDQFEANPSIEWLLVGRESCYTVFTLVALSWLFAVIHKSHTLKIVNLLSVVFVGSIVITFTQLGVEPIERFGLSQNASMNGCLIAVLLPVFVYWASLRENVAILVAFGVQLAFFCVYAVDASVPIGTLAVVAFTALAINRMWNAAGFAVFIVMGVGLFLQREVLFASSGRWGLWKYTIQYWREHGAQVWGFGTGTGHILFPNLVKHFNYGLNVSWVHNEYLQTLFENGIVGLVAFLLMVGFTLWNARNRVWLLSACMGYAAYAFFNYPAHIPLQALVGCALIWLSHTGRTTSSEIAIAEFKLKQATPKMVVT